MSKSNYYYIIFAKREPFYDGDKREYMGKDLMGEYCRMKYKQRSNKVIQYLQMFSYFNVKQLYLIFIK